MEIDKNTLYRLAELARLEIKPEQEEKLTKDLFQIINWVAQLQEVNTDGIEPLLNMSHEINAMREDVRGNMISNDEALSHAKQKDEQYFLVNKVIDNKA
ncbi:MAG: Asp-tRNA(Asn)/Glu-tRNA(Gln) amidotransferase subunit GatC [Cyclobacteriaceae bacterium]|jgi:aspartyl-tRNA(Asn)/glutamyl-tRNA(Gln) amidotransferase subunit C|nr:Asp-tRNA(Asn)/Glu-tRNA(Gln) amidotransferase subunit GatC [Cyclobacteriaceae bacterium]